MSTHEKKFWAKNDLDRNKLNYTGFLRKYFSSPIDLAPCKHQKSHPERVSEQQTKKQRLNESPWEIFTSLTSAILSLISKWREISGF